MKISFGNNIGVIDGSHTNNITIQIEDSDGEQLKRVVLDVLPSALELFARKNEDYGDLAETLGERAQFVDMWRKMGKLKRSMWEGEQLQFEQPKEILQDFVGHVLLTIDLLQQNSIKELQSKLLGGDRPRLKHIEFEGANGDSTYNAEGERIPQA